MRARAPPVPPAQFDGGTLVVDVCEARAGRQGSIKASGRLPLLLGPLHAPHGRGEAGGQVRPSVSST